MINAADAMKLIFSHPAATAGIGGLIGGSGALVYNAFSQPTLDEYGNPIESNDINPLVAAGIGSGVGLVGGMGAKLMTPQNNKFGSVYSQVGRQTPQEIVIDLSEESPLDWNDFRANTVPIKQVQIQNNIDTLRNEITDIRTGLDAYKQRVAQGYDDFRGATIPIRGNRQPNPTVMPNPQLPSGFQEQPQIIYRNEKGVFSADNPAWVEAVEMESQNQAERNRQYKELVARNGMAINGWRVDKSRYSMRHPEDNQYNLAGWDLIDPSPEGNAWNRELNSDAIRYQKWLESEAIIRGQNQRPQITGDDLFDANGNMILDYPQKKIV